MSCPAIMEKAKPEKRPLCPYGRDVVGSKPYEFGLIARNPKKDSGSRDMLSGQRKGELVSEENTGQKKAGMSHFCKMEFDRVTDKKILVGKMRRGVRLGVEAAELELDKRRHKLRNMLLDEEVEWSREYVDKAQRADDNKMEEFRLQAQAFRVQKEAERAALAEKLRLMQYSEQCMELRESTTKNLAVASKETQRYQMIENKWKKEQEREVDRFYAEVLDKNVAEQMAREEEDHKIQKMRDNDMLEVLNRQREGKRQLKMEQHLVRQQAMREHERQYEELQRELQEEAARKEMKCEQLRQDLLDQVASNADVRKKREQEEQLFEQTLVKLAQAKLAMEKDQRSELVMTRQREMQLYRDNLALLRKERAEADRQFEQEVAKVTKATEQRIDHNRQSLRNASLTLQKEVNVGRHEQRQHKLAKKQEEKEHLVAQEELFAQMHAQQMQLRQLHNAEVAKSKRQYGEDLAKQVAYSKLIKERERVEAERLYSQSLLDEKRYTTLLKNLTEGPPVVAEVHPFKALMDGDAVFTAEPEVNRPPVVRMTFPCHKLGGAGPPAPLLTAVPNTLISPATPAITAPTKAAEVETPATTDSTESAPPSTAAIIAVPCQSFPQPSNTYPVKVEVPCYIKHMNNASTSKI